MAFVLWNLDKHSLALEGELHLIATHLQTAASTSGGFMSLFKYDYDFLQFFFSFLVPSSSPLVPNSYLQEVPSTPSHHSSLFAFKAIYHHHQVHVRVFLPDGTITPNSLYFVVCILRK